MVAGIFAFLTGIGLLLYGVHFMGQSTEKLLGTNFRKKINKYTSNRFASFGFGTILTFALQSSTASTAIFVGFAGAGIITLYQGVNLIIGCNVGTALSSFLLAFKSINVIEIIASFALIGCIVNMFAKENVLVKNIGNTLIGFGILFGGLVLIDNGTAVLKTLSSFDSLLSVTNPALLILIGIVLTSVLQSSFGTFAVIISFMSINGSVGLSLVSACYLVYGVNIGTCLTSLILGYSSNTDGKRVAWFHTIFNLLGTVIFTILTLVTHWVSWLQSIIQDAGLQVLIVNMIFNLLTAIICLIIAKPLTKLVKLVVKRSKKEINSAYIIRTSEIENPTIAIKKLNFGAKSLFEEFKNLEQTLREYILISDSLLPKKFEKNMQNLKKNCELVSSNAVKLSCNASFQNSLDIKNIVFIQDYVQEIIHVLDSYQLVTKQIVVDNKKLKFSQRRQTTLNNAFDTLESILIKIQEIINNFYEENTKYNCIEQVNQIIMLSSKISSLKNEDKIENAKQLTTIKDKPIWTNFLNIMNEISNVTNTLVDISLSMINFFESDNLENNQIKGE